MRKPNESGIYVYIAVAFFAAGKLAIELDPSVPNWFVFLLGCSGGILLALVFNSRFLVARELAKNSPDPTSAIEIFKVDLGFFKF